MDQVSPAMQFGMEKVETCSWESSSPHACQSSDESILATSLEHEHGDPTSNQAAYSVLIDDPENCLNTSRDSTEEPLSPSNLQILQHESVCKEEQGSDYSCVPLNSDAAMLEVPRSKKGYRSNTLASSSLDDFEGSQIPNIMVPAGASSSSTSADCGGAVCSSSIPQSLQFGTHLQPGMRDNNIVISLEGAELWHQFFQAGTEMIITKSGRYAALLYW